MPIPLITHPEYSYPFSDKHRFPMGKFALLRSYLESQGIAGPNNIIRPGRARQDLLEAAHCSNYLQAFQNNKLTPKQLKRMGLPWSEALVKRSLISPNGTFLTANLALQHGIACHLAGGTHHAHYDFGSGFCIINDLSVTALGLIKRARHHNEKPPKVLIFDCDVHQGDGTATTCAHEPLVFTCSIHCEKNFPVRKAKSDLDVNLPVGLTDDAYLTIVQQTLEKVIDEFKPDLVLYDAGVDIYQHDPLGLIDISLAGIRARDELILRYCKTKGVPVATVIGGGYDKDQQALAQRHAIVVESAARIYSV